VQEKQKLQRLKMELKALAQAATAEKIDIQIIQRTASKHYIAANFKSEDVYCTTRDGKLRLWSSINTLFKNLEENKYKGKVYINIDAQQPLNF